MSNFRRVYVPGGSYIFTVVTERRANILGTDLARDLLSVAFRDCFERWPPVRVDALVMLRDHLQPCRVRIAYLFGCRICHEHGFWR